MIRSAEDVIAVVCERGLEIRIEPGPPPMPFLHRPAGVDKAMVTETLLDALRAWRLEIIEIVSQETAAGGRTQGTTVPE